VISKNSVILLVVIAVVATIISVLSYQYSTSISTRIVDIASQEIRSNAIIEAHDLSQILSNRLETMTLLLQTLADSPAVQNNEYQRAYIIINYRQNYTNALTDFYMWLDQDGKIVWISNINSTTYKKYKGFDLSYRPYFTVPKNTFTAYYSSLIESNDKVPRLYVSYPILSKQGGEYHNNNVTKTGSFKGLVVTAMKVEPLGNILKSLLLPQFNSTIGLLDSNGIILYNNDQSYIGKHIFGKEFQSALSSTLSSYSRNSLNELLKRSLQGNNSGSGDIYIQGRLNTIAYEPVVIEGKHFLTLYLSAPHNLASNVRVAIDQLKNFTIFMIIIIGSVAFGIALLVLAWNRRLETIVNARTEELMKTNALLTNSNKQLEVANEQLKYQDKIQKEFINTAAHELRTPIQPIIGLTDVLKSKIIDKDQNEFLEVISRNAKRLSRLSQDILDVTMIESGLLKLNKEQVNLNDLILHIVEEEREQILKSNNSNPKIFYEEKVNEGQAKQQQKQNPILVTADKGRIAQVISNLLSNAVKFTKDNDNGTIYITLDKRTKKEYYNTKVKEQEQQQEEAIVNVKDTGNGIHPDIMPRLFTKFATKSYQGTGLGLYISKNIIEAHGGKMWAENNSDGKGATFYFSLPLSKEKEQSSDAEKKREAVKHNNKDTNNHHHHQYTNSTKSSNYYH
jgi:signal transduction histidine kinase